MASPNCRWASLRYKSALQTTKAPPLSAGLITMSLRAWSDWRALNSLSVRLDSLLGLNLGSCSISCRHCRMNSSRDPYWSSGGDQEDFLGLIASKTSLCYVMYKQVKAFLFRKTRSITIRSIVFFSNIKS